MSEPTKDPTGEQPEAAGRAAQPDAAQPAAPAAGRRPAWQRALMATGVVVLLGGLFLYGLLRGPPDRDIPSNLLGQPAPDFELPLYARYQAAYGPDLRLSDARQGRPMVINFWASWCVPCYEEAPHLQAAWRQYGEDVLFVGVQTQDRDQLEAGRAFLQQFDLGFPNVIDNDSRVSISYGLFGVPETFFIRADGTVAHKHVGPVSLAVMHERVGALLR